MKNIKDIKKLIRDVFDPRVGENVIILNDFPSEPSKANSDYEQRREMAKSWHSAFQEMGKEEGFSVEGIITYQPTKRNNGSLPQKATQETNEVRKEINLQEKLDSLNEKYIVIAITRYSATAPLFRRIPKQRFRAASMPGASMNMTAFDADYKVVAKKAYILKKMLDNADKAIVIFSTSHECTFDLRGREGHADDGKCTQPGESINLPSGESYVAPYEGRDETLGKSLTQGEIPVYYEEGSEKGTAIYIVDEGKISKVKGEGNYPKKMNSYFLEDSGRKYIAEFGLGCNDKAIACGCTLQDEKIEGFHWAYGCNMHLGGAIGTDDFKKGNMMHQDTVYAKGMPIGISEIRLINSSGEQTIMKDNKYLAELGEVFE